MELSRLSTPQSGRCKRIENLDGTMTCHGMEGLVEQGDEVDVDLDPEAIERNEKIIRMKRSFDRYVNGSSFRVSFCI